ncbi:condensation domain-containing protein, partial [Skermania piniformis]
PTTLREHTSHHLPDYMIPTTFITLDTIPLTINGKLDHTALPTPELPEREHRAPVTAAETAVAEVFAEVLGVDQVGLDDDFFALGGNSLIASRVVARIGVALDTVVPIRVLFEAPDVAGLAERAAALRGAERTPLTARERPVHVPLSFAQSRMWLLNRIAPDSIAYNIPFVIRLSGPVDVSALRAALTDVVARHEVLRTVYPEYGGTGYQRILDPATAGVELAVVDPIGPEQAQEAVAEVVGSGFDVTESVPVRARLWPLGDRAEFLLAVVVHHISADGFSMGPLVRDVITAYTARLSGSAPDWPMLPVQYADYALWQREVLGDEADPSSAISTQLDYWREQLAGIPDEIGLPLDGLRRETTEAAGYHRFTLSGELRRGMAEIARADNATMFMVVHAALAVTLARTTGGTDIVIGTGTAGRGEAALDDLVGMFVNTLVLRTPIDLGARFDALLAQVRETDVAAFGNSDVPFERLIDVLNPPRSPGRNPLFQVMLAFQNLDAAGLELPGLTVTAMDDAAEIARFDLQLTVYPDEPGTDELVLGMTYPEALFEAATVRNLAGRLRRVVEALVADPQVIVGDIDILDAREREQLAASPIATEIVDDNRVLPQVLAATVEADPEAPAYLTDGPEISFAELDADSSRLARLLIARGVGAGTAVAISRTGPAALISLWAVWKAGAVVVALESTADAVPAGAGFVLADHRYTPAHGADTELVICDTDSVNTELSGYSARPVTYQDLARPIRADDPALILPGADRAIGHGQLAVAIDRLAERHGIDYESCLLLAAPLTSRVGLAGVLLGAVAGPVSVLADESATVADLVELVEQEEVSHAFVGAQRTGELGADSARLGEVLRDTAVRVIDAESLERW